MRKHGTNRPSIAAIFAISALLVTSLVGSAFAGRGGSPTGSNSQSGAAAWLVDSGETTCTGGSPNTNDNYITDDRPNVWIKSTSAGFDPTTLRWEAYDGKNKLVADNEFLNSTAFLPCGTTYLMEIGEDILATGSVTVKFFYADGKSFSSDTARFA